MSLEDVSSDLLSDGSDHDAEERRGGDEADYQELMDLHGNLTRFGHIYTNNAIMDMQSETEDDWPVTDFDYADSVLNLNQDFIHGVLDDVPFTRGDDWSSSDAEDPAQISFQDYIQLYEAVFGESAPSSSDSSHSSDNTDSVRDEDESD